MKKLSVLVGCEFSGIVTAAFRARSHDAFSCDLLPAEQNPHWHLQGDVFSFLAGMPNPKGTDYLAKPWDLLIFHWPCTRLCLSGVRWLYGGKGKVPDSVRWLAMEQDALNFRRLLDCGIPRICGENPIPHRYAREIMGNYTCVIQPYEHGHGETKATCLWLKNLPPLKPSNIVEGRKPRVHFASPRPDRWKERSRTLPGIAAAMAEQWGNNLSR